MAIPPVEPAEILKAMERFDRDLRDSPDWQGWETRASHKFAIERNDQRYPVKRIVSLATDLPVSDFSGGVGAGQANAYVEARGFKVTPLSKRNPPWTRDELILALDLYLQHRNRPPTHDSEEVVALSETLNSLGEHLQSARYESYRNPNGVYMKLMNFRRLDPHYPDAKGLPHGARLEAEIWEEFANSPEKCRNAAAVIQECIKAFDKGEMEDIEQTQDDFAEAAEGRAVTRLHISRERNRTLVKRKKDAFLKAHGKLFCEACGFEFKAVYGERGENFIERHHIRPVSELVTGEKTKIKYLKLLCANCHRIVHTQRPWLSIEKLCDLPGVQRLRHRNGMI